MHTHFKFRHLIFIALCLAAFFLAFACSDDDSEELDKDDGDCERGTELVLDLNVDWADGESSYRFWLIENDSDFLSGDVLDESLDSEFVAVGETKSEGSYSLSFSPGKEYAGQTCETLISLTAELKDLAGTVTVYCDSEALMQVDATGAIVCDDTGVTLD